MYTLHIQFLMLFNISPAYIFSSLYDCINDVLHLSLQVKAMLNERVSKRIFRNFEIVESKNQF
jgi:hypothetical protein